MYKFGARYYNPALERWTQPDPIDQAADLREGNRYVYAASDPTNLVDAAGTFSLDINVSLWDVEAGAEIDPDPSVHTYVGAGGGVGGGVSVSASRGKRKDGPVGGGCVVACAGASSTGGSFGAGIKPSAGIYYRHYLT
jgi:hypothetical protein